MSDWVVETERLTKRYGDFAAVDALDLKIQKGEVYGLLGPNGSGKTTTILMLLGLTEPSAGQVRVLGLNPVRQPLSVKSRVGYLPDRVGFYENMTARENLIYTAKLNGLARDEAYRRIDAALEQIGLGHAATKKVNAYSHGMRQRLGVAELLVKRPALIIMDEPTLGLDPDAARLFLNIIRDLKAEGNTILLASHLLHQVQAVCDRVGLFNRGRLALEGTVKELARRVQGGAYRVTVEAEGEESKLLDQLSTLPDVISVEHDDESRYVLDARADLRAEAAEAVVDAGGRLKGLNVAAPNLDDIYAQYFEEVTHAQTA